MIAVTGFRDLIHRERASSSRKRRIGEVSCQCSNGTVLPADPIVPLLDRLPVSKGYGAIAMAFNAALLRINSVEPLACTICRFFRSANSRVTVSREVPIICAISSCVSASFTRGSLLVASPLRILHSSRSFASFSPAECDKPSERISRQAELYFSLSCSATRRQASLCSLQEAQEVFPLYEVHLAGIDGFGGQFVGLAAYRGAQAEHFAGLGDLQDQSLAIGGADGQLHPAFAQDKDAARRLAFYKKNRALGISGCVFNGFEGLQRRRRQIAEDMFCAHLARQAAFDDV